MRTIAHISDLHFGTEIPELADGLRADLAANPPSLIAVSGDHDFTLSGFTVRNGRSPTEGGAIRCVFGGLTVLASTVSDNRAALMAPVRDLPNALGALAMVAGIMALAKRLLR